MFSKQESLPSPPTRLRGQRRWPQQIDQIRVFLRLFVGSSTTSSWGSGQVHGSTEMEPSNFNDALSTLTCLVSLKTWTTAPASVTKGEQFLWGILKSMTKEEDLKFVPVGMQYALAAMLEEAALLGLDLPRSCPLVQNLRLEHDRLLDSLRDVDIVEECPRKLLCFPEGLRRVIVWEGLRKLQSSDGSLFSSLAVTACFFIETSDAKALHYISAVIGNVETSGPCMYPARITDVVRLMDHLWRLNIERYFHSEVKTYLDSLLREPTDSGHDLETLAADFRALRAHGYHVQPTYLLDVVGNGEIEKLGVQGLVELYRASELMFPGEILLEYTKDLTTTRLSSILKLPGNEKSKLGTEVEDVMGCPLFFRLPSLESMKYIDRLEQEEGAETYLEMTFSRFVHECIPGTVAISKLEFNKCQSIFQKELETLTRWKMECRFDELPFDRKGFIPCFITAAAGTTQPEFEIARTVWTYGAVLTTNIDDLFDEGGSIHELRLFAESFRSWDLSLVAGCSKSCRDLSVALFNNIDELDRLAQIAQGRNLRPFFIRVWQSVIDTFLTEAEWKESKYQPSLKEYFKIADISFALEPITLFSALFRGEIFSDDVLEKEEFWEVSSTINRMGRMLNDTRSHSREKLAGKETCVSIYMRQHPGVTVEVAISSITDQQVEYAHRLLSMILSPSTELPKAMMDTYLAMMRSLYLMYFVADGYRYTSSELKLTMKRFLSTPFALQ